MTHEIEDVKRKLEENFSELSWYTPPRTVPAALFYGYKPSGKLLTGIKKALNFLGYIGDIALSLTYCDDFSFGDSSVLNINVCNRNYSKLGRKIRTKVEEGVLGFRPAVRYSI